MSKDKHEAAVKALIAAGVTQLESWGAPGTAIPDSDYGALVDAMANATVAIAAAAGQDCPHCVAAFLARACNSVRAYSQQAALFHLPPEGTA